MMATETNGEATVPGERSRSLWDAYLIEKSPVYRGLAELRQKGWENPKGDVHFSQQRQRADNASEQGKVLFFDMMEQIGREMNSVSSILTLPTYLETPSYPRVLDLGIAPGGFASIILKLNPDAVVSGITLQPSQGGHEVLIPGWEMHPRLRIEFGDITMRAAEMDVTASMIPEDHPDHGNLDFSHRLFTDDHPEENGYDGISDKGDDEKFDLIICDGHVLRTHAPSRAAYREGREAVRLIVSQLVIGLRRLRHGQRGGSLLMLLHKADALDNAVLLSTLSKFARLQLFKPSRKHNVRSSFYVLATDVQAGSHEAFSAVSGWKKDWVVATLGTDEEWDARRAQTVFSSEVVNRLKKEFGETLVRLAEPVWRIQAGALRGASFIPWRRK